ncbi:MAG: endopeptidase La [Chloroflexi bacterium]|nr:endopeptidase La [Chloroflexota bacterium]
MPQVPDILPVLPSGPEVVYPFMVFPLILRGDTWGKMIDEVSTSHKMLCVVAQRNPDEQKDRIERADLFDVGTAVYLARMVRLPDGNIQALLQGVARVRLTDVAQTEPFLKVFVQTVEDEGAGTDVEAEGLLRNVQAQFQRVVQLSPQLPQELLMAFGSVTEPGRVADFVSANLNLSPAEKQDLLETAGVAERLRKLTGFLAREIEILEVGSRIQEQIKGEMDKTQREYYLRQQLEAIRKELGEGDERTAEISELKERLDKANLPEVARKEADRELERLSKMPPQAAEYTVSRTYLDWLAELPWDVSSPDKLDIKEAKAILDADHYDLDKIKDRILDYLAVRKMKDDMHGPILCLVGPPGVGKTSLGMSIAKATGRKFYRLSLGGMRDEAEIRGFRRTYIGSMPGRVIQAMKQTGTNNPVLMLDEIDKLGADFRGDPAAALLEVLDPEQNNTFTDHYLDVPFDLSKVMFITTANQMDPIPGPLRDRMEVIALPGYSEYDKLQIARRYLAPRQCEENGLSAADLELPDETLKAVIERYTREAGVRNLERNIGAICRKVARKKIEGEIHGKATIGPDDLDDYLGHRIFRNEITEEEDEVGVATGLAWTEVGGDVLFVEASMVPGHGNFQLTGQLGNVMQESARAALTYARSRAEALGIDPHFLENHDIHVHVPAGAVPKDGPSAGVTMATAITSAITKRPVNKDVAMTGEITLRGRVLPVGGIKEKMLAAHRAGVKAVCLPRDNEQDLDDLPKEVRDEMRFIPVDHVDEVLNAALRPVIVEEKPEVTPVAA